MKGAIFYASKYGSTEQYANWIGEATGLPVFNIKDKDADPSKYDLLLLGAPIIYYKLYNRKWIKANWSRIESKTILLFTVSGAPGGDKLDGWITNSNLPSAMSSKMTHFALQGRQKPEELSWFDRQMLKIAARNNPDPVASREERFGFDYMDRSSIESIVKEVQKLQSTMVS